MEFLKEILGDELYAQFAEKVNAHNGNEANKDKLIKLANLASGEYVGKGKYEALEAELTGNKAELLTANNLIAELKKGTAGNENLQNKIADYETQVNDLQKQLQETKVKAALKVALLSEKAVDVDYLSYKINEKMKEQGKILELDENEHIKGIDEMLSGLKVQFPNQFAADQQKQVEVQKLPDNGNDQNTGITAEAFSKMGYQSRLKLKQEHPEVYAQMTGRSE